MSRIIPYINFANRSLEAVEFYKSIFGGDADVQLVKDSPMAKDMPAEWGERVMHLDFTSGDVQFFGSDIISDQPGKVPGNQMSLAIACDSPEQLHEYYDKLVDSGKELFAPADSEWGSVFAQCVDKFDVQWMLDYAKPTA